MKCSICRNTIEPLLHPATGEVVWEEGNNAWPINDGRCCDVCDSLVVLPFRIQTLMQQNGWTHADTSTEETNSD